MLVAEGAHFGGLLGAVGGGRGLHHGLGALVSAEDGAEHRGSFAAGAALGDMHSLVGELGVFVVGFADGVLVCVDVVFVGAAGQCHVGQRADGAVAEYGVGSAGG